LRSEDFVSLRREDWNHLEDLLARAGAGHLNALTPAQVLTMASLYRRATADLARAQRDWPGEPVHRYLNGLVARGHGIVYRRGGEIWRRVRGFYVDTLPRTYRQSWRYLLAAGALMFVPALISFFVVLAHPDAAYGIAGAQLIDRVHHHQLWTNIPADERVQAGGLIMVNNIYVSILAFGLGVFFGLPVIWVMISNGIALGGLFGLTQAYGIAGGLFEFVIGHGVLELSIVIAQGAGGLMTFDDRVTAFIKPERGAAQLRRITESLYAVRPAYVEPDFGHAMTHLALRVGRRSMIVLLTDVQDAEASRELVAHALRLAARHLVLVVAMSDPAVLSARDDPIDGTNRAYEWAAAEEFVASRRQSFELLRRGGVLGLDVVAGQLSPLLVERYLELKERALL